jgi:hypothetical protein
MQRYPLRPIMSEYDNRRYCKLNLDKRHCDSMNNGKPGDFIVTEGCLDALDHIPAGSIRAVGENYYDQTYVRRGR